MSLGSKVNNLYWELETFERKLNNPYFPVIKYITEANRLRSEINRLHCDAYNLDEALRYARIPSQYDKHVVEIEKRIYILRHQIGFANNQYEVYMTFERNPPTQSTIFSSPSNSPASSPEHNGGRGGRASSVYFNTPVKPRQETNNLSQSSTGSSSSGGWNLGSQGQSQGQNRGFCFNGSQRSVPANNNGWANNGFGSGWQNNGYNNNNNMGGGTGGFYNQNPTPGNIGRIFFQL